MKKTTSKKLSQRLTQYGALTVAIGGIAEATGQELIVYTDLDPDVTSASLAGNEYQLNVDNNGDGNHDFSIDDWAANSISAGNPGSTALKIWIKAGNAVAGENPSYFYPFALDNGAVIDHTQNWLSNGGNSQWQTMQWLDGGGVGCAYASNWCEKTDKFLGLRFEIAGETHYGWAKLDVPNLNDTSTWTIKEYAYHTTPDTGINAGQTTTLGVEDSYFSKVKIVALGKTIGLYNLPEKTNYKLFAMTGQEVLKGDTRENVHAIDAKVASGVYIVELEDANTKAVMRKKIVL